MHTNLLIDSIVNQTTVLIARLSTAAGIRAPLAHIADQVFVELAGEIESQGVSRKVAADMFGMALRTYQKKVNRLAKSRTEESGTLWEGILNYLTEEGTATRRAIEDKFIRDDPQTVGAVLRDLVTTGLAYRTGSADSVLFGVTPEADLSKLVQEQSSEAASGLAWVKIYRAGGLTQTDLEAALGASAQDVRVILDGLIRAGRVNREGEGEEAIYRAARFVVPVGSSEGWEAAVFDHFQAVSNAISQKLSMLERRSDFADEVGGTTLSFDVYEGHPFEERVRGLLSEVRKKTDTLWDEVAAYNEENPVPEDFQKVTFYAGQSIQGQDE